MNEKLTRRKFLKSSALYSLLMGCTGAFLSSPALLQWLFGESYGEAAASEKLDELIRSAPLARFWASTKDSSDNCATCHGAGPVLFPDYQHREEMIKCLLCAQGCTIRTGERGKCRTRVNVDGELRSLSYGHPISMHVDPIEKKPFYHFLPGSTALSIATAGCPLHCKFCQNWELSQSSPEDFPGEFI
ncbi:MAG: twin-arginine translocation signal domain-containing protein, partial [Calditrichaeota bacterium]|nr:twin-arginine translocation signal domain-containing protein [Calditrichota bacterium]